MTKLTLVTDSKGKLIAAVEGHELSHKHDGVEAHVSFAPGHKLHRIDVDIDLKDIGELDEFEKKLARHIPKG
jgi:hypothetical protein